MRFFTYSLTSGSITINSTDSAMFVSVQCDTSSGGCTVAGNFPFKNLTSTAVSLGAGQGINLSALTSQNPLDGLTITWVSGTVDVVIGF
jgi:hypothetical protein